MATAASSYNVLIRVQAAQARREVRQFSAELAAAKRMAQSVGGLSHGTQSSRTLASSNAQVTTSYRGVTNAARTATAAVNAYAAAAAKAATANTRLSTTSAAAGAASTAAGRRTSGSTSRMAGSATADSFVASSQRANAAATTAATSINTLTAAMRTYSTASKRAATSTTLLESALLRLVPAAGMTATMLDKATASAVAMGTATGRAAGGATSAAAATGAAAAAASSAAATTTAAASKSATAFTDHMNRLRSLGASMTWAGRQISMTFTLPFAIAAGAATMWQLDVEKAATRMMKVYDDLDDGMLRVVGDDGKLTFNGSPMDRFLTALSNKMGQTKAELTEVAADWAAVGLTGGNVAAATKLTTEAMLLGDMEAAEAVEALVAIQAQYNLAFGDFNAEAERARRIAEGDMEAAKEAAESKITLTGVLAQLNMVENQTATSMQDLILGFSRSAVFAKEAGVEANYLAAHLAALIPATGSAERAGNALKTIYASLSTDKSAPQIAALERVAINAGLAADAFTNAAFRSRGMSQGIEEIARAYVKMAPADKLQWGKDVFGIYQMVRGMHLLEDVARGVGEEVTDTGKSISILASQFSNLESDGARAAFVMQHFGVQGEEAAAVMEQLAEKAEAAGHDISYYRQALSGQHETKTYKQYAQEMTQVLESNPQKIKQAWVIIQNSMMKAIIPLIPTIIAVSQTVAKWAKAFADLDPRWQKLIIYAGLFLAVIGPLSILLGSTLLMFSVTGLAAFKLAGLLGLLGGKVTLLGAAFRGLMRFLSGGRLFSGVTKGAKAAGTAMDKGVTAKATGLGGKLSGIFTKAGGKIGPALMRGLRGLGTMLGRFLPQLLKIVTGPVGWIVAGIEAIMWAGGESIMGLLGDLFSGIGDTVNDLMVDDGIPILAKPFVIAVRMIGNVLAGLPDLVFGIFRGLARGITNIAKLIYKAFSYINPFARHSPSLVENVTRGMGIVADQFGAAGASISVAMRSAYADIAAFGSKTASLKLRADQTEVSQKRQVVGDNAPAALPEFDRLTATRGVLSAHLERVNEQVKAQEDVVDSAQRSIDAYDRRLEKMNRSLEMSQRRLDAINKSLDAAQKRYDHFASANIAGLREMEDAIFANEMAQKRLELAMKDAGADELETTSDLLAKIAGQIDDLAGRRNDLRMAGAGSDILGVYDQQISGLRSQQRGLMDPATNSIRTMADELEALQAKAERMELEKSLAFDPLTRQIERFKDTSATLPFDQIMAGLASSRAQTEFYQAQVDSLTSSMDSQRAAITSVEDARYAATQAHQAEKDVLDALTETQGELEQAISDIDAAISLAVDSVEKYTAALDEAKRATEDLASASGAVGGDIGDGLDAAGLEEDMGGALDIPGEVDIEALTKQLEDDVAKAFDGVRLFPSFSDLGQRIKDWWNDTVVAAFKSLPGMLWEAISSIPASLSYLLGFIIGELARVAVEISTRADELLWEVLINLSLVFLKIKDWVVNELPGIIGEIDWRHVLGVVLGLLNPSTWIALVGLLWDKVVELGKQVWPGFLAGVVSFGESIFDWVKEHIVDPFVNGFKRGMGIESPSRVMAELGGDTMQGLINGITGFFGRLGEVVREIPGNIIGAIGDAAGILDETGKEIVRGLWNGIKSLGGWLKENVGNFVKDNLPGPVKKALEIQSPSRVFMEIGRNVGEGMALGIESTAARVSSASESMAAMAADAAAAVDVGQIQSPTVQAPTVQAPAAQQSGQTAGVSPFEQIALDAATYLPQAEQAALASADGMAAGYTATVAGMEQQVLTGQQAYTLAYATNSVALATHTIATAQQTSVATVATATAMATQTIAIAQQMAVGVTSTTDAMATGVTNSANNMALGVVTAMTNMATQISAIVNGQIAPVIGSFDPMLQAMVGWFDVATNNVGTIWAGVQPRTADPARFVINEVYNKGLRGAWNSFNEFLGLDPLPEHVAHFRTGGRVWGAGTGTSDSIPALLSHNEHVITAREVRGAGGHEAIERQRQAWARGRTNYDQVHARAHGGAVQAFAGGGAARLPGSQYITTPIQWAMHNALAAAFPGASISSGTRYQDVGAGYDYHMQGMALDIVGPMNQIAQWIARTYGPSTLELIHAPEIGFRNIWNGRPHAYSAGTMADHYDHVHWATNTMVDSDGKLVYAGGGSGPVMIDWGEYIGNTFKEAMDPIRESAPTFPGRINEWVPKSIDKVKEAEEFLAKKAEEVMASMMDVGGSGVERWRGLAMEALRRHGYNPEQYIEAMLKQIEFESGGNPRAVNNWDINAINGVPSGGLLQVIEPTYRRVRNAYPEAFAGLPDDRFHPLTNLTAGVGAVRADWGGPGGRWPTRGGYDEGGWLPPTPGGVGTYYNHTGKPEAVLTSQQWNAIYRSVNAKPVDYTVSNADLARRINEQVSDTFTDPVMAILGQASRGDADAAAQHAEAKDFWTSFDKTLAAISDFAGQAKELHEANLAAINETNEILASDDKLADVAGLVTSAMNEAFINGGKVSSDKIDALTAIATDYFAPAIDLAREAIRVAGGAKPSYSDEEMAELTEAAQASIANVGKLIGAWQPVVTSLTGMVSNIADLKQINLGAWAHYGTPSGFGRVVEMGLTHLGNIGVATFNLTKNVLPALLNHGLSIGKTVVDFAAENAPAVAALVGAVVTGNPLAALPYLPQLLSLALNLIPQIIAAIREIVPALVKGLFNLIQQLLFGATRTYAYDTMEAAERAVAQNIDAIRKGTFVPGSDVQSGTLSGGGQSTNVTINGDVVLPNIKNGNDAKKFITNLESLG